MSCNPGSWYNELYRIFADSSLLTVAQTIKLGQCLRSIQAGENAEYHLNELYYSVRDNKRVAEPLDEFIHSYLKNKQGRVMSDEQGTFSRYTFPGAYHQAELVNDLTAGYLK